MGIDARPAGKPMIIIRCAPEHRDHIADVFLARYAFDYGVDLLTSDEAAMDALNRARDESRYVALVCVPPDDDGLMLVRRMAKVAPTARKLALVPPVRGAWASVVEALREASGDGRIDTWLAVPAGARDEEFHAGTPICCRTGAGPPAPSPWMGSR